MLEAMSMSMRPKCSVAEKKEKTDKEIRANKKYVRRIVKETREVDALLQEIKEKHLDPSMLHDNETRAFARAIGSEESCLIEACLKAGADPNYYNGSGRPLEKVERLRNIKLLLQYKADPKLCIQSPLIKSLIYYIQRQDKEELPQWATRDYNNQDYYKRCWQEKNRHAEKALKCLKLLLQAGANANQESNGFVPLRAIVTLTEDNYLSRQKAKEMVKALVAYGANPDHDDIKNYIANSHNYMYDRHKSARHELALYMHEERQKYQANQAVRQLLIGHYKNSDSPLSRLPKDIFKEIGILVKKGFFFKPVKIESEKPKEVSPHVPDVKKEDIVPKQDKENKSEIIKQQEQSQPSSIEEPKNNVPVVQTNAHAEGQKKHSEPASLDAINLLQKAKENPGESMSFDKPYRSIFAILRCNPKVLFAVAASSIACWMYTKWKDNKEEAEDEYDLDY